MLLSGQAIMPDVRTGIHPGITPVTAGVGTTLGMILGTTEAGTAGTIPGITAMAIMVGILLIIMPGAGLTITAGAITAGGTPIITAEAAAVTITAIQVMPEPSIFAADMVDRV